MNSEPIWFHVNGDFESADARAPKFRDRVAEYFDKVIGEGGWLHSVPDVYHFAEKFGKYAERNAHYPESGFIVLNARLGVPGIVEIHLLCSRTSQRVSLHVDLDHYMGRRRLGCYAPLPIVRAAHAQAATCV